MSKPWTSEEVRTFIEVVRANPILYDKRDSMYKNTKNKDLAWATIASILEPPCSGEEAKRKFKSLRDTFNRENKRTNMYVPSGAKAEDTYLSMYEYYYDLLFLSEHIQGRKTKSNMTFSPSCSAILSDQENVPDGTAAAQENVPDGTAAAQVTVSNETLAAQGNVLNGSTAQLQNTLLPSVIESLTDDILLDSNSNSSSAPSTSCVTQNSSASGSTSSASLFIRSKAARAIMSGVVVPPSDRAKRERRDSGDNTGPMAKLANAAVSMSEVIMDNYSNNKPSQPSNKPSDGLVQSLQFGLDQVPSARKIGCMIDLLRVIEVYTKGTGEVVVTLNDS